MGDRIKVAVIGAGMAGLTAALRLAERGFEVTVYEQSPEIGGQFGAHRHAEDGLYHEHCYHMLLGWYRNFWQVARDIGLSQERDFEPRSTVAFMWAGDPRVARLTNPGSVRHSVGNLVSGVAPPPDMFLYGYSLIDLLAHRFTRHNLLDRYSVNGFMQSRPYASERSAEMHHYSLAKIFASPSYLTSAASYQSLVKYSFRHPDPMMWILKGDTQQAFLSNFRKRLKELGCAVRKKQMLRKLQFRVLQPSGEFKVERMFVDPTSEDQLPSCYVGLDALTYHPVSSTPPVAEAPAKEPPKDGPGLAVTTSDAANGGIPVDYVILAVPPKAIAAVVSNSLDEHRVLFRGRTTGFPQLDNLLGQWSDAKKNVPNVPKLKVEQMASVDLYFNKRLPGIPKEHVVLIDSEYGLTFIDNSRAWPGNSNTVLNVVASDFDALSNLKPRIQLNTILEDLRRYITFDPEEDLEKDKTHFQPNLGAELFINEVGSEQWRPRARTDGIKNLFLAGDYCRTIIDVVTIEGAVVSGLQAAEALRRQVLADLGPSATDDRARPIAIHRPDSYSHLQMVALKIMLAPSAYAAMWMSWLFDQIGPRHDGDAPGSGGARAAAGDDPMRQMAAAGKLLLAPWVMAADAMQTMWSTWMDLYRSPGDRRPGSRTRRSDD